MVGYSIVFILLLIPILVIILGVIYHRRRRGSDSPEYVSILKCFINVADLYTDIIFCIMLQSKYSSQLYIPAIIFTALPHFVSIATGMYHIHQWRKKRLTYVKRYDNLIISMTVLGMYHHLKINSYKINQPTNYKQNLNSWICSYCRMFIKQTFLCDEVYIATKRN